MGLLLKIEQQKNRDKFGWFVSILYIFFSLALIIFEFWTFGWIFTLFLAIILNPKFTFNKFFKTKKPKEFQDTLFLLREALMWSGIGVAFLIITESTPIFRTVSFMVIFGIIFVGFMISLSREVSNIGEFIIKGSVILAGVVLFFATAYMFPSGGNNSMYERDVPANLSFVDATYFSIGTLTTSSYGDIQPTGWYRTFAIIEVLVGIVILGLFINGFVKLANKKNGK